MAKAVNAFGGAFIGVGGECGLSVGLRKGDVSAGVKADGSCIAALVGIVGAVRGSVVVLMDRSGFDAAVSSMSGGMIVPSLEDPMSVSVLGELVNMVCGRSIANGGFSGTEVTPPHIITGENIRNVPAAAPEMRTFTLPFDVRPSGSAFLVLALADSRGAS